MVWPVATEYKPDVLKPPGLGRIFEKHNGPGAFLLNGAGADNCRFRARQLLYSKFTSAQLLDRRLVCRQWRDEIHRQLQNTKSIKFFYDRVDALVFKSFTIHTQLSTLSPFKASSNPLEDLELLCVDIGGLVNAGLLDHIPNARHLVLFSTFNIIEEGNVQIAGFVECASRVLQRLPNVRCLVLNGAGYPNSSLQIFPDLQDPSIRSLADLLLVNSSLPLFRQCLYLNKPVDISRHYISRIAYRAHVANQDGFGLPPVKDFYELFDYENPPTHDRTRIHLYEFGDFGRANDFQRLSFYEVRN